MLIEVKGVQFVNKGAALMLQAILDRLQRQYPAAEVALAPGPNAPFRQVIEAGAWQRLRMPGAPLDVDALSYRLPRRIRELGRRHGVVTESDVDAVLDASGFAYGAAWDHSALASTAREIERLASHGKPYVFLPQSFGPFDETGPAHAFGRALRSAALVCAREIESRDYIQELAGNLGERLAVYPDFTVDVAGTPEAAGRRGVDRRTALIVPNAEMVGDRNPDEAWTHGYVPLLASIANRFAALGFTPRVLNHEGASDAALCESLREAARTGEVITEADPRALKGIVGGAGVVVCSRYHGCVNALVQGVPCLGTAWSHKYAALFNDFGVGEDLLTACDEGAAAVAVERLVAARDAIAGRLAAARPAHEDRPAAMWARV
ncbi:MAG: polysaccharide pyruvyl transferase family protein, partial [Gammaproteobacteria bacterium]|nr:polysaccharide pyruvyl transferase family protein [Gammaproteobacteria bacterium]